MGKEYYTTELEKEEHVRFSEKDFPKKLGDVIDENGLMQMEVEREAALNTYNTEIYTNPMACIREYINNEARPCREAIKLGHNASLHITINTLTNTICIEGINSMGMTMDTFRNVYRVLGRSGNFDGTESGQYGIGRGSYYALSDVMIFETYSRKTKEKFGFISKGGSAIQVMTKNAPIIKKFGSRATMTIRKKRMLDQIILYVRTLGMFLNVPTYLHLESSSKNSNETIYGNAVQKNTTTEKLGPVSKKKELMKRVYDTKFCNYFEMENDDYKLYGIACPLLTSFHSNTEVLLIGIPTEKVSLQYPGAFILDIKNERKYKPVASRDMLSDDARGSIIERVSKDLDSLIAGIKINTIQEFLDSDQKYIFLGMRERNELVQFLHKTYFFATKKHYSVEGEVWSMICGYGSKLYHMKRRSRSATDLFFKHEPNGAILIYSNNWNINEAIVEKFILNDVSSFLADKRVRKKSTKTLTTLYDAKKKRKKLSTDRIPRNAIKIPKKYNIENFFYNKPHIEHYIHHKVMFIKETARTSNAKCLEIGEMCENAMKSTYQTTDGTMTGAELLKEDKICIVDLSSIDRKLVTPERCKKVYGDCVILEETPGKNGTPPPSIALLFASYETLGVRTVFEIQKRAISELVDRNCCDWARTDSQSWKYLSPIKNRFIRNLYSVDFRMSFRWETFSDEPVGMKLDKFGFYKLLDTINGDPYEVFIEMLRMESHHNRRNLQTVVPYYVKEIAYDLMRGKKLYGYKTLERIAKMVRDVTNCSMFGNVDSEVTMHDGMVCLKLVFDGDTEIVLYDKDVFDDIMMPLNISVKSREISFSDGKLTVMLRGVVE